jgi:hypothetical protein
VTDVRRTGGSSGGLPETFDVKGWRERFVGANTEDSGFFDPPFGGLIKVSYNQIKLGNSWSLVIGGPYLSQRLLDLALSLQPAQQNREIDWWNP